MRQLALGGASYSPRLVRFDIAGDQVTFDWGLSHELGTAAFWTEQARRAAESGGDFRLGHNLAEEVTACLLGGHGVPSPVALAAFERLRTELDLSRPVPARKLESLLEEPLAVAGRPRPVRYRFPRQRAGRIAAALRALASAQPPEAPLALREWLRTIPGIGPKTASWIVRNVTASSDVAIIDIHIWRAGVAMGCFLPKWKLPRDYPKCEMAFLLLAERGNVPAAHLDATIWYELQRLGATARLYGIGPLGGPSQRRLTEVHSIA